MELNTYIQELIAKSESISENRISRLGPLLEYLKAKQKDKKEIHLNFVCTHNSRRSQLSQIWAQTAADYYNINCKCYSSGVEVTAFNYRAINALKKVGFLIDMEEKENPICLVKNHLNDKSLNCFSKLLDDEVNPKKDFAAVMTCSHADENCPVVFGMEVRIPLNYEDPGKFDGTPTEEKMYLERSEQIATEMFYLFSKI
jgi:arsenate reductase